VKNAHHLLHHLPLHLLHHPLHLHHLHQPAKPVVIPLMNQAVKKNLNLKKAQVMTVMNQKLKLKLMMKDQLLSNGKNVNSNNVERKNAHWMILHALKLILISHIVILLILNVRNGKMY
jgi:hypothetical protein